MAAPQRGAGKEFRKEPAGPRPIVGASTSIAAFIGTAQRGPTVAPTEVSSLSRFEKTFGSGGPLHAALHLFFTNGGMQALVVRQSVPSLQAFLQALRSLETVPFNLLCLPPGAGPDEISFAALTCEKQLAFLLLDPPAGWTDAGSAAAGLAALGTASPNAAVYYPALAGRDAGRIPPSPAIAGLIARTDAQRGIWKAPAGLEADLQTPAGLERSLTEADIDLLQSVGINSLRHFPGQGDVVWGARTLAGSSSDWKYVPIRRTALFIESSILRSTRWAVFEPNAEPLWAQLRALVEDFLMDLFRQGAFAGTRPEESFFVRCGPETTTAADIAARRLNLLLGVALLSPAEFIVQRLQITTA